MHIEKTSSQEISLLQKRLAQVETELARRALGQRRRARIFKWGASLLGVVGLTWTTAVFSQTSCDAEGDLPDPLITFCPGEVASAFDVNWNFREMGDRLTGVDAAIGVALADKLNIVGTDRLFVDTGTDASLVQSGSAVFGDPAGGNITIDGNELLARNNGASGTLYINGSDNTSSTYIQGDGGRVYIGNGDDAVRLTVRGNLDVQGSVDEDCPGDTTQIGDSCIDNTIHPVSTFFQAQSTCSSTERHVCSAIEYAACDRLQPSGSTCSDTTDNTGYSMWTSTMTTGNWSATQWKGGVNSDTLTAQSAGGSADFYCCEYL